MHVLNLNTYAGTKYILGQGLTDIIWDVCLAACTVNMVWCKTAVS